MSCNAVVPLGLAMKDGIQKVGYSTSPIGSVSRNPQVLLLHCYGSRHGSGHINI